MSGGRHRSRFSGYSRQRGLRPLTVVALCCVVAVLAVWATQATHPYNDGGGSTSIAGTNVDGTGTDDGASPDPSSSDDPSLATDPASDDSSDSPSPTTATTDPAPAPAPAVPAANGTQAPPPVPVPVPEPDPTTTQPSPTPSPTPSPSPTPRPVSIEAENSANTLTGTRTYSCTPCSGGKKVGNVGNGDTLVFNNVSFGSGGQVLVVLYYVNGDSTSRTARVSVNGGNAVSFTFKPTGDWNTVGTLTLRVTLRSGTNKIAISNPSDYGPDFDKITVKAS